LTHLKQQVLGVQQEPDYELKYIDDVENGNFEHFDRGKEESLKTGILYQNKGKTIFLLSDKKYWCEIHAERPENWRRCYRKDGGLGSQYVTMGGDNVELVAVGVNIRHCMDMV
jgi:hypothetical protein